MTTIQREIVEKLLQGHYLRKTRNHARKECYKLYSLDGGPVQYCRLGVIDSIERRLTFKGERRKGVKVPSTIFKKDKLGRITLNLSSVRRIHGASWIARMYKERRAVV